MILISTLIFVELLISIIRLGEFSGFKYPEKTAVEVSKVFFF